MLEPICLRQHFGISAELLSGPLFAATLVVGLGLTSLTALGAVWTTWVMVSPEQAARVEVGPWTNRIGLVLAIAWPIQCGLGLVVLN